LAGPIRKILLRLVLEDAVVREEYAYRFYESALERVSEREARKLLQKLCAEELRHRMKLERMQSEAATEEIEFSGSAEIELLEAEQSWPEVPDSASRREILEVALVKEKQAVRFYRFIAGRSVLKLVKDLFLFLTDEESRHVRWVEKMLGQP
jgi:rubrerythrin